MNPLVFTHVPAEGFAAFAADLSSGPWAIIDSSTYEGPNNSAAKSLGDAPTLVVVKLRLMWGIRTLVHAVEAAGGAKMQDRAWDGAQKQLNALLSAAAASNDPAKREAASRLQKVLLAGAGEAQTKLRYQQEVDFGRKQALFASQGQSGADVALLGLQPVMAEIAAATDTLAATIGHGDTEHAPYARKLVATAECAATFVSAAHLLGWLAEHGSPGPDRERAIALRVPLEELVARYPAPEPKTQAAAPVNT